LNHIGKKKRRNDSKQENIIYIIDQWGPKIINKLIHYQLGLKGKIKNNKIFIKELREKNHKNKDQIENTNTW
jgi:hypothetical protein